MNAIELLELANNGITAEYAIPAELKDEVAELVAAGIVIKTTMTTYNVNGGPSNHGHVVAYRLA